MSTRPPTTTTPVVTLDSNADLYNSWAKVYDTDGNVLQQLDALAFQDIVIPLLTRSAAQGDDAQPLRILDLGCGTGRNTTLLAKHAPAGSTIYATDLSQGMLEEAKQKISAIQPLSTRVEWALIDLQTQQSQLQSFLSKTSTNSTACDEDRRVDALVSTLVLEHVELDPFFSVVADYLKSGGWAWVTDMHPEMGTSRAAFRSEDGVKIVGISFFHGIEAKLEAARKYGLEIIGQVDQRGVGDDEAAAVKKFGSRATKWVGKKMLCGMLLRKV